MEILYDYPLYRPSSRRPLMEVSTEIGSVDYIIDLNGSVIELHVSASNSTYLFLS